MDFKQELIDGIAVSTVMGVYTDHCIYNEQQIDQVNPEALHGIAMKIILGFSVPVELSVILTIDEFVANNLHDANDVEQYLSDLAINKISPFLDSIGLSEYTFEFVHTKSSVILRIDKECLNEESNQKIESHV